MSEMIVCPHPLLCGAQKHRPDKGAIEECRRRGQQGAMVREQAAGVLASAASAAPMSPGESRFEGLYALAELREANGISPDGRHVGVDIYDVELEAEHNDMAMTATFAVPHGDLPPQAREVISNLILDRDSMRSHSSDWRSWAQANGLSTERGGSGEQEWNRTLREHGNLMELLGEFGPSVANDVRKAKKSEQVTLAPVGVSPQAVTSMDKVLGKRPIEALVQARPADLFVDMIMSGEEPVDLNDVVAWQGAVVGNYLAQARREAAAANPQPKDSFEVSAAPMRPAELRAEMAAAAAEDRVPSDAAALLSLQSLAMLDPVENSAFTAAASGTVDRAQLLAHLDRSRHDRGANWNDEQRQAMDVLARWTREHD